MPEYEAAVPIYYTVKPQATDEEIEAAFSLLKFTPVTAAFIFSPLCFEQAHKLSEVVRLIADREQAYCLTTDEPHEIFVWISGEDTLVAYYADGSKVVLC